MELHELEALKEKPPRTIFTEESTVFALMGCPSMDELRKHFPTLAASVVWRINYNRSGFDEKFMMLQDLGYFK